MIVNTPNQRIRICPEEILTEILEHTKLEVPEIQIILLVSSEGLPIASSQGDIRQDETILSAMTAAIVSVSEQASLELEKGEPSEFIVKCPTGLIVLKRLTEDILISVVTRKGVRLGLLLYALNKAQTKICETL